MKGVIRSAPGLLLGILCLAMPLRAQNTPYTLAELVGHVRAQLSEVRILALARQRCLGFTMGSRAADQLREAGASAQLVRDLRTVCSRSETARAEPVRAAPAPLSLNTLISRGDQLRSQGNPVGALRLYRQAAEREPTAAHVQNRIGLAQRDQRLFPEALTAFRRAIELRPDVGEYHADVASAYNGLRQFQEAEAHARDAVRLRPTSGAGHFQLGIALAGMERPYDAQEALAAAYDRAPRSAEYRVELERVRGRMNVVGASKRAADIPEIDAFVESVRFYSSPTTNGVREYRYRLPRQSTRSVGYEISLRHPNPSRWTNFEIVAVFYLPGGREWFRDTVKSHVSPTSGLSSYHGKARGFDTPGRWGAGRYNIDFLHQGERIASSAIEIVDSAAVDIDSISGYVASVRFFEVATGPPPPVQRSHRHRFPASTSRYFYVTVELVLPARSQRVDFHLQGIYYAPDGSEIGRVAFVDAYAPPGAAGKFSYTSLGADVQVGKWAAGRHRVDVTAGSRIIASGWFDMY
jgi:tetratricopeptide (TPR) repeat protein